MPVKESDNKPVITRDSLCEKFALPDYSVFEGKNRCPKTLSLFKETNHHGNPYYFTLEDRPIEDNGRELIALRQVFLEIADPTEWLFAELVFGSWHRWQTVSASPVLSKWIKRWRSELEFMIRSNAVRSLISAADEGSKGTTAAKYVAEYGWDKGYKKTADPILADEFSDDAERMGLKSVG